MKLIDNWRQAPRWSSVRIAAFGAAAWSLLLTWPDLGLELWNALPAEALALLPAHAASWVPIAFYLLIIFARLTRVGGDDGDA